MPWVLCDATVLFCGMVLQKTQGCVNLVNCVVTLLQVAVTNHRSHRTQRKFAHTTQCKLVIYNSSLSKQHWHNMLHAQEQP